MVNSIYLTSSLRHLQLEHHQVHPFHPPPQDPLLGRMAASGEWIRATLGTLLQWHACSWWQIFARRGGAEPLCRHKKSIHQAVLPHLQQKSEVISLLVDIIKWGWKRYLAKTNLKHTILLEIRGRWVLRGLRIDSQQAGRNGLLRNKARIVRSWGILV